MSYISEKDNQAILKVDRHRLNDDKANSDTITTLSLNNTTGFPSLSSDNGKVLVSWNDNKVYAALVNYDDTNNIEATNL